MTSTIRTAGAIALLTLIPRLALPQQIPLEAEWYREFGSRTGALDSANAVAVSGQLVYVAGHSSGALPGQVVTSGRLNAFVMQRDAGGQVNWIRQFGALDVQPFAAAADDSGVYVGGMVIGELPGQTREGNHDAFIRKYDAAGNEAWTRQFAGAGFTEIRGIAVDGTGVYVCGLVTGNLPGLPPGGSNAGFLRKYSLDGAEIWTRQVAATSFSAFSQLRAVATAESGIYVTGFTSDSLFGHSNLGRNDAFVIKFDAEGQQMWARQFGSANDDVGQGIAADGQAVYVVGRETNLGQATQLAFVRAYSTTGTLNWVRTITSPFGGAEASAAAVDASGVYLVGNVAGSLPGFTNTGAIDAFARKYTAGGQEVWTHQFGSVRSLPFNNDREEALAVAAGGDGIFVAGTTGGRLDGAASSGGTDAFVRRYDPAGGPAWLDQFGSLSELSQDIGDLIAADGTGHVYVAGTVPGPLPGQTPVGRTDAYLRKYDGHGREVWTRQFGDPGRQDAHNTAFGLAVDSTGVYVVGRSSGGPDVSFIRKFDADGNPLWMIRLLDSGFEANAIALHEGAVYVAGVGDLRKYQGDGTEIWRRPFLVPGRPSGGDPTDITTDETGVYIVARNRFAFRSPSFLRKISHDGVDRWTVDGFRCFGNNPCPEASAIVADGFGVYVGGKIFGGGMSDTFVMRFDSEGNELWNRSFAGTGFTSLGLRPVDVAADRSGVYVTGGTCMPLPGQSQIGSCDPFVRKYDPQGVEVWTRQFGRVQGGWGHAIAADGFGIHVAGVMGVANDIFLDYEAFVMTLMNPAAIAIRFDGNGTIRLSGNGVVPVTLLTSEHFDATTVDAAAVCFGAQADATRRSCTEAHQRGHVEDVDGDGVLDLMLHYRGATTGLLPDDATACLAGRTASGMPFKGCQAVRVVR